MSRMLRLGIALAVGLLSALVWLPAAEAVVVRPAPRPTVTDPLPGESFILSGTVGRSVNRPLQLQRWHGGRWHTVKKRRTGKLGGYRFTVTQPTAAARWRVVAPRVKAKGRTWAQRRTRPLSLHRAAPSASVAMPLVVRAAAAVSVPATFRPARPGRAVALQAQLDGVWRQVARAVQDRAGNAAFRYTAPGSHAWAAMRAVALPHHGAGAFAGPSRPFAVVPAGGIRFAAHRGASATHPENTLPAIRAAIDQGADYLELDFRRTKDPDGSGPLEPSWILMHDAKLTRTTDIESNPALRARAADGVGSFTLEEIKQLDAGAWKAPRFACPAGAPATHDCRVPTLEEAVAAIASSGYAGRVLFEVKPTGSTAVTGARLLELYGRVRTLRPDWISASGSDDEAVFMSFDHAAVRHLLDSKGADGVETAVAIADGTRLASVAWAAQAHVREDFWGPHTITAARRLGLTAAGWTVDSATDIARLAGLGADIVTTDSVPYARRVLLR